ncbi:four helix bundle protein [Treponema sp.]|uniref:four helix bundle protein n=1 Tax=Treponema sp. TaxID=166 RepID=UPI00257DE31A|nr:four helix bundle protein [Treponema sp.]
MALYYDLPVFKDVYKMTLEIFRITTNFSREYKFTLGQDLKRDCILLVRHIYRANKTKEKTIYLENFDEAETFAYRGGTCQWKNFLGKSL